MAESALHRRISEFTGVALFAAALLWLISLVSYTPADPVWFFNSVATEPGNFAGRFGAFLAEVSFQLVGYSSFRAAARGRIRRVAPVLVQGRRRGVHEARRQRAARAERRGDPRARGRSVRGERAALRPGRRGRRVALGLPRGVPQPDRRGDPAPHLPRPFDRPLDAVLVRPRGDRHREADARAGRSPHPLP